MHFKIKRAAQLLAITGILLVPEILFAQESTFTPLTGVPGVPAGSTNLETYIGALFTLTIGIAAALAVLKIIVAGTQLMTSQIVPQRSEAKRDIGGALLGLLLILGSITILNEINPELTSLNILRSATPVKVESNKPTKTTVVTDTMSYTEAQELAHQCGGELYKDASGVWKVKCETTDSEPEPAKPTELEGWPQTFPFAQQTQAGMAGVSCEQAGGRPESEQTKGIPPDTIVHCYSQ